MMPPVVRGRIVELLRCPDCRARRNEIWQRDGRAVFLRCESSACAAAYALRDREQRMTRKQYEQLTAKVAAEHARYQAWVDRIEATPRTQTHRALRPSAKTRRAWRQVRKAKTRPALQRRYETFLGALRDDAADAPTSERPMTVRLQFTTKSGLQQHQSWAGVGPAPTVRFLGADSRPWANRGLYTRSWMKGVHEIRISDHADLDDIRRTLVHETLHYVDAIAQLDDRGHGVRWRERLAKMERMFNPTFTSR